MAPEIVYTGCAAAGIVEWLRAPAGANSAPRYQSHTKSMKLGRLAILAAAPVLLPGMPVLAQDDAANAVPDPAMPVDEATAVPNAGDDEAITVLDQTVPVSDNVLDDDLPLAEDPPMTDRELLLAEFERFKELRRNNVHDEAENVAKRIVELSIRLSGPRSEDTAKSLTNLGVVQHQMGNYDAAQQNFQSAIEIIEDNTDQLSATLINPLKGLGQAQLSGGRPDLASRTYKRAVHITHVNEGPHNIDQVEILEALAETNLRLGLVEDARNAQDMIYALNMRHYDNKNMEIIPALMRRAEWQRRTGYILDERATYRRIIRIIETRKSDEDLSLIEPLMKLGESYFFVDTSDSQAYPTGNPASGELFFKRAARIAEENPDADWLLQATTRIALGDYYNFRNDVSRARKSYRQAWALLSVDEDAERLEVRRTSLESVIVLNPEPLPRYTGGATRADSVNQNDQLREGRIIFSYDVTERGRVTGVKVVELTPADYEDMQRVAQRELRTRVFRPRFEEVDDEPQPVDSTEQVFTHTFYYLQDELDRQREAEADTS